MTENRIRFKNQNISIEDREKITITGVEQVESYNDNTVILNTIKGAITVKGEGLNISKLNLDEGSVIVDGKVNGINYSSREAVSKNIMGRLFK
ncbi:MAG: sporulation protein YabP [Tissierellaceae bacterium]